VKVEGITTGITTVHVNVYIDGKLVVSKDVDGVLDVRPYMLKSLRDSRRD
jgi:hypothetical protein